MAFRWRIPRLRFSLLALVLAVLLVGGCYGVWQRWAPWERGPVLSGHTAPVTKVRFSPDG